MPRKQRIEYAGAVYHLLSRGNYRKELFLKEKTGEAFERCLFGAVDRCSWKLHAYVIMSNNLPPCAGNAGAEYGGGHKVAAEHVRDPFQPISK